MNGKNFNVEDLLRTLAESPTIKRIEKSTSKTVAELLREGNSPVDAVFITGIDQFSLRAKELNNKKQNIILMAILASLEIKKKLTSDEDIENFSASVEPIVTQYLADFGEITHEDKDKLPKNLGGRELLSYLNIDEKLIAIKEDFNRMPSDMVGFFSVLSKMDGLSEKYLTEINQALSRIKNGS